MKILTGIVRSTKMAKTIVVETTRLWRHPLYQKQVKRTKRFLVHDTLGVKEGDRVVIEETRPMSRLKHFKVREIVKK